MDSCVVVEWVSGEFGSGFVWAALLCHVEILALQTTLVGVRDGNSPDVKSHLSFYSKLCFCGNLVFLERFFVANVLLQLSANPVSLL